MTIYGHYLNIYKTPLNSTVEAVFFVICKAIIFNQHPAFSAFSHHFALGNIIFGLFGAPRGPIFQISRASGLPESLFLEILRLRDSPDGSFSPKTTRRGIPKHCFSEFQPFGMPRSPTFPVFRSSLVSETLFLAIFDEKTRATGCFLRFSHFAHERRMIFSIFWLSPAGESQFSLLFRFPSQGKTVFCCFLVFPHKEKLIFAEF